MTCLLLLLPLLPLGVVVVVVLVMRERLERGYMRRAMEERWSVGNVGC